MSDAHAVASQLVRLVRATPVDDQVPMPPPRTVTLVEPVAARFVLPKALMGCLATETPCVRDPIRAATDIDARQLPLMPLPARLKTDDSDIHVLCSAALAPTRAPTLVDSSPNPAPCTVTLLEPVDATLLRPTMLAIGDNADKR